MTARPVQPQHDFADCSALYQEAVQRGDPTRLCPPSVRRTAAEGDTVALAIQHPLHDDATELVYATITQRTADHITATVVDPRRIQQPTHYSDGEPQQLMCTLHEGDTIECEARHFGWVVDQAAIRQRLGWGERRRSALDEMRESERRQQKFEAATKQCTFEKGSAVSIDAAVVREEERWRKEEQKSDINRNRAAADGSTDDIFEYEV